MLKFFLVFILFVHIPLAVGQELLQNDREEGSFYVQDNELAELQSFYKRFPRKELDEGFQRVFTRLGQSVLNCSFDLLKETRDVFTGVSVIDWQKDQKNLLYSLREMNKIDDVILGILLKATDLKDRSPWGWGHRSELIFKYKKKVKEILSNFELGKKRGQCQSDNFKSAYSKLMSLDKGLNERDVKKIFYSSYRLDWIDKKTFHELENLRRSDVHQWPLTLTTYLKKKDFIKRQINDDDFLAGLSSFVTKQDNRTKSSLRERLYQNYDQYQIALMSKVIENFRERLEETRGVGIRLYNDEGENFEEIKITNPLEHYRLFLRLLRVEMNQLSTHVVFSGKAPNYRDLLTAAFEMGRIPATEMDELSEIEYIWNPRENKWDKVLKWVKTFGRVATVAIPQPYGFISSLAFVAIEAFGGQNESSDEFNHSLFQVN